MTDTNPYYYTPLTAEEISTHSTNILLGFESRKIHKDDQLYILREAQHRLLSSMETKGEYPYIGMKTGSISKSIHMEQADKVLDYVKKHCCKTVDLSEFGGPYVVAFMFSTDMK